MRSLQALGVNIESVPRQGYRLPRAVDLLDKKRSLAELSPATRALLDPLEVLLTVDSTNRYVAEHAANPPGTTHVCVAEMQNAGRGRRGRSWVAPFGCGICMSLGWQFVEAPPTFSALESRGRRRGGERVAAPRHRRRRLEVAERPASGRAASWAAFSSRCAANPRARRRS